MSVEQVYLAGTVLSWIGWICLAMAAYKSLNRAILPAGPMRDEASRGILASAIIGVIALLIGALVPMHSGRPATSGLHFPIVWVVLPFSGWSSIVCLLLGLHRLYLFAIESGAGVARTGSHILNAVALLIVSAGCYFLMKFNGDGMEIIRGAVTLSPTAAILLVVLLLAVFALMAAVSRAVRARNAGKAVASHIALIVGSVVFGLPFAWAIITSLKEDRDMSSPQGLVWIPKVQVTVPYRNPNKPVYTTEFDGEHVEASLLEKLPDGRLKLEIQEPKSLLGRTTDIAPSQATEIDVQIPLVTGTFDQKPIEGKVIDELEDGRREVEIITPASLKGQQYIANPTDVEPVRHVGLRWQNYPEALQYLPPEAKMGLVYIKNTLILVVLSVLGTLLSSSIVAYAFSRLKFPGKKLTFTVLLSTMMLPSAVTMLPTFLIFKTFGWIDTLLPLWVPMFFGSAFNIFLLRQFFMTVPMELEDASKIDGCSYLRSFWSVMLPQVKPALAVITILTFVGVWNNFMGPLIYLNSPENMTVSYALQLYQGDRFGEPGLLMAFATMGMLPVILLFFAAQRYFIEGVTLSGLGGR